MTTYSPCDDEKGDLVALECVVGRELGDHRARSPGLGPGEFEERVSGSGGTGVLDGPTFLATLMDWVLAAYSGAFERLEERLEEFDVQAMRGQTAPSRTSNDSSRSDRKSAACDARSLRTARP